MTASPGLRPSAPRPLDGVLDSVLDGVISAVPSGALRSPGDGADDGIDGVAALLTHRVRTDPARPLLTFYDDATGERTELSAATVDNWVAKTANLLVDTLGVAPGDTVRVALPPHWQTAVVLLAAWSAGLRVAVGPIGTDRAGDTGDIPAAVFVTEGDLDTMWENRDTDTSGLPGDLAGVEVTGLSLHPMGGRLARSFPGVLDFAGEVLSHGDRFPPARPPANQRNLIRIATHFGRGWNLSAKDRILTTAGYDTPEGLLAGLLSPLGAGASIVLCRNLDPAQLPKRIAVERVTAVCGPLPDSPAGTRRLVIG